MFNKISMKERKVKSPADSLIDMIKLFLSADNIFFKDYKLKLMTRWLFISINKRITKAENYIGYWY